jgi:putative hydrolase of the HAD superfamily
MTGTPIAVFDLGMVLAEPVRLYESLAELLGVTPAQMADVYYIHRRPYDMGLPDRDYWTRTLAELGVERDLGALLPHLVEADVAGWSVLRPAAGDILRDLNGQGVPVIVLSNAPNAYVAAVQRLEWRHLARQWFFSAPLGLTKPDAAIYRHVERALDAEPGDLWFTDDRPENVAGARDRGWHAHQWRDDADTRAWLTDAGLLSS